MKNTFIPICICLLFIGTTLSVCVSADPPNGVTITGPINVKEGEIYIYTISGNDPEGGELVYITDWGDGSEGSMDGPYQSGEEFYKPHIWNQQGVFTITVQVKDLPYEGDTFATLQITVENQAPTDPKISGPSEGNIGELYKYNFVSSDPENNDLYFYIDWGDGNVEKWIGPYDSGTTVTKTHKWDNKESYTIKAKTKDSNGQESDWSTLEVTMPVSVESKVIWFFERLVHQFPFLEHLLSFFLNMQ